MMHKYRGWVDEAYDAKTRADSIIAWRRLFGNDFAKDEDVSTLSKGHVQESAFSKSLLLATAAHLDSLVDDVLNFGLAALPRAFYRPPHQKAPPWRQLDQVSGNVQVSTNYHVGRHSSGSPVQRGEALPRHGGLWFTAHVNGYQKVPEGFRVEWRVTDTGTEALLRRAGRGNFYPCQREHMRWEELSYRGVHIAEAFIIRRSDDVLVGQSEPFEVVIR